MESVEAIIKDGCGTPLGSGNRSAPMGQERGKRMAEMFLNAFVAVRAAHSTMLERARSERGASMVEYALLVGLIAVVAVVAVGLLGGGIANLFGGASNCVNSLSSTSC
jgi:pilus assembly protein Flp/PilA